MCIGGPKFGGSNASSSENVPPVSAPDTLTDISKLPRSIVSPSPVRSTIGSAFRCIESLLRGTRVVEGWPPDHRPRHPNEDRRHANDAGARLPALLGDRDPRDRRRGK